jgi:AbiU2
MNSDQIANIDATVTALSETLTSAWGYFHLLRGIHEGGRENPEAIRRYSLLFDQTWQAIFEGLFAKTGTLLDKKSGTYSLPNLVTMIRRYGDANLKQLLPEVEACLSIKDGLLEKIKNWRHQAVAHHPLFGRDEAFYTDTKMNLDEIESALMHLEDALNRLSFNALGIINDTRTGSTCLVEEGQSMFTSIAVGIANETVGNLGAIKQ